MDEVIDIDKELLQYRCAIYPSTFSGEFKYTVFRYGNNGISYWFNKDIGFVSKTTAYINRDRSWYNSRQEAYEAAIKRLQSKGCNQMAKSKVTWIIEGAVFKENIDALKTELTRQEIPFELTKYVSFKNGKHKDPKGVDANGCVLFYGSLGLMRQLLREKAWIPCGYCTLKNFECSKYYTYFGKFLLNQDYIMVPALELLRQKEFVYDKMGVDGCVFVRPSSGFKEFAGAVVPLEEMDKNALGFGFYHENPELMTVVTTPKTITKEWRFVVAKKKVITGSQYRLGKDVEPELVETTCEAALYAQSIVDAVEWEPDPIYTLDICESNGELFLLELNGFSTSGLYDCDLEIIVRVASKMAQEEWAECHESV